MKKFFAALLCALALSLCACGETPDAVESPVVELPVIGISQVGAESDWRHANTESMKSVFTEENGYRILFEDARQKQENQILAMRKFIHQQVDYIVLMPIGEYGWEPVLQDAREAGIPVILVDRMVNVDDESLYTAHVGSDFYRQGEMATEWMAERYAPEEEVKILHILGTPESTAQIGRTQALENAVQQHENWQIIAQLDGDFTQAKAYSVVSRYLDENPGVEIDLVYCENDNEAYGAIEALEERGYVCGEDVEIISFDATRRCLQLCLEGKIALAVECNPLLGPPAEEIIRMLENGEIPEKQLYVPERCFTKDDLSEEFIASREY